MSEAKDTAQPEKDFVKAFEMAIETINQQGGDKVVWLRDYLHSPVHEHLSFVFGNKVYSVIIDNKGLIEKELVQKQQDFCKANNLTPAVFAVDITDDGIFKPRGKGWNLFESYGMQPINPESLATDKKIEMSDWEVHDLAVKTACHQLRESGKLVATYQTHPLVYPAIWMGDSEEPEEWVVVQGVRATDEVKALEVPDETEAELRSKGKAGYVTTVVLAALDDAEDKKLYRGDNIQTTLLGFQKVHPQE